MGLNLNINRIIFSSVKKFNAQKKENVFLTHSELKQIAGRAGRSDSVGYVSSFDIKDLDYIKLVLKNSISKKAKIRNIEEIQLCN